MIRIALALLLVASIGTPAEARGLKIRLPKVPIQQFEKSPAHPMPISPLFRHAPRTQSDCDTARNSRCTKQNLSPL
jgi:hypothetical protein